MMKRQPVSHCRSPATRERGMSPATGERILTLSDGWSAVDAVPHGKSTRFSDVRPHRDITVKLSMYRLFQGLERQKPALYDQSRPGAVTNCGSWWRRRLFVDQRNSVFAVFSCNWLEHIHAATSSMHADIRINRCWNADGRQEPRICVSSAKRCGLKPWLSISGSRSSVYSKKENRAKYWPLRHTARDNSWSRGWWAGPSMLLSTNQVASEPLQYHTAELECMF